MGIGLWLTMGISFAATVCCAYLVFMGIQAGDMSGMWLFAAFGILFVIPRFFGAIRLAGMRNAGLKTLYDKATGADQPQPTRFVPHWFMMTAIVILGIVFLYGIISVILSVLW